MSTTATISALQRNNVTISGNDSTGRAILFLHGLGTDQNAWHLLAPAFEESYRVVLMDLVGAGRSDLKAYQSAKYNSLNGHAADVLAVLEALDLYEVVFVGHSVSAMIGVLAAIQEPRRFAKLVLLSPSPRFINEQDYNGGFEQKDVRDLLAVMESSHQAWAQAMAPLAAGADNADLIMQLTNSFSQTNPSIAQHFANVTFYADHRADLGFLSTPALILQNAEDVIVPLAVSTYLHQNLPGSELAIIETQGHCAHLTAPDQTLRAIERFFL